MPILREHISHERAVSVVPDLKFRYGKSVIQAKKSPYVFMEFVFRKSAHLFVYGVLAGLAGLGLRGIGRTGWRMMFGSLFIVGCAAVADEWNQLHHAGRTGAVQDIVVDMAGGLCGIFLFVLIHRLWKSRFSNRS